MRDIGRVEMIAARPRQVSAADLGERLLVFLLSLATVAALFLLRGADDNRLTSWRWVFAGTNPLGLYALVAAGLVLAQLVTRIRLSGRRSEAVLFLAAYGAAACFWGAPEVIVDAARYFTQAKYLELHGVGRFLAGWGKEIAAWTDLPLVPLLDGLVFRLVGESRTAVQAFTTLLFAGTVVITRRLGSALWDEEVGFLGGALLLASPYLLTQVPAFLVDVPTMFFVALAVFTVVEACLRPGAVRIVLASLAVFLAFFSKYSTWLLLSVLPIAVVALRKGAPRVLRTGAAIALVSATLVLTALLLHRDVFADQLRLLLTYQAPGLRRWGESFASTFLFQIHPFVGAAALLSAWVALRRRDARWAIVAWPVLILLVLEVRRMRYLVPALPMLALMGGYGLRALRRRELARIVAASAVASALVVAVHGHLRFLRSTSAMNLEQAGAYLDAIPEEQVEVYTRTAAGSEVNQVVSVPILDLYTRKRLVDRSEPARPPAEMNVAQSPLRFTWEFRLPAYYAASMADTAAAGAAVVVVSGTPGASLGEEMTRRLQRHRLAKTFAASEGLFGHATFVDVYRPASAPQ